MWIRIVIGGILEDLSVCPGRVYKSTSAVGEVVNWEEGSLGRFPINLGRTLLFTGFYPKIMSTSLHLPPTPSHSFQSFSTSNHPGGPYFSTTHHLNEVQFISEVPFHRALSVNPYLNRRRTGVKKKKRI